MITDALTAYVRGALPAPPARVLEIGAGDGDLSRALRAAGYDVTAIDPASEAPDVLAVALLDVREPPRSFDAAVAVVSLHHVEPLEPSVRRLAELLRDGAAIVVDELDSARFDERAARWLIEHRAVAHGHGPTDPARMVEDLRDHVHPLATVAAALSAHFDVAPPVVGPYLHRWALAPELQGAEEALIAAGDLPAIGLRIVGSLRHSEP